MYIIHTYAVHTISVHYRHTYYGVENLFGQVGEHRLLGHGIAEDGLGKLFVTRHLGQVCPPEQFNSLYIVATRYRRLEY